MTTVATPAPIRYKSQTWHSYVIQFEKEPKMTDWDKTWDFSINSSKNEMYEFLNPKY